MKISFASLTSFFLLFCFSLSSNAQQRKAVTFQQQVQSQRAEQTASRNIPSVQYRLLANFEYANVNPSDLNNYRSLLRWNGTTAPVGSFSAPIGFSVGAGYSIWDGFLGFEFGRVNEELGSTTIAATTTTIQDSFDLEHVSLTYDYVIQNVPEHSFEIGAAVGAALKFRYYQTLESNGTTEVIMWQDNPIVFKLRGAYNYHFSENVRFRVAAGYELVNSNNMTVDAAHPSQTIVDGQKLRYSTGEDVKVDFSGLRATAGLVVAF